MIARSKLLATVAIPIMSIAAIAKPVVGAPLRIEKVQVADSSLIQLAQAVVCADGVEAADQAACDAREAQRQAEAEAQRQAQEAEAQQRQAQEAEAQRQAQEAEAQRQAQEAEAQRQAQEAEAQRQAQEAEAQRQAQEAEAQRQAQEAEAQRQAQEAEAQQRQAQEAEAQRQAQEAEAQRQAQEAEAQQKQAQEAEAQRQAQEAEAQQRQAQEAEAQKQAQEAEAQRLAQEAEAKRQAEQQAAQPPAAAPAAQVVTCADGSQAASPEACPVPPAPAQAETQQPAPEQQPAQAETQQPPATAAVTCADGSQAASAEACPVPPAPAQAETQQPAAQQPPAQAETQQPPAAGAPVAPPAEQAVVPAVEPPVNAPVPQLVETLTEEQKQQVAKDPSKTTETVVLPETGGAAVLDSDKDADNSGGVAGRETRAQQRAQEQVVAAPTSDAAAQPDIKVDPQAIQAAATESGTRLQAAPTFAVPPTVVNNITNVTNVTNVTNNTTTNNNINNGVQNNVVNQVTQVKVIEQVDNRTIINVGNQVVVRSDDRERMRYEASDTYYEELPRGRVRETIIRSDESRIVTVYNRYGDIIQRSRISPRGREYVLIYAPEADRDDARVYVDVGFSLPPMRLTVPVSDYIVTTSRAPDRDYYEFLAEPPVERVERVYSMDEVKSSARLRDKVRRIDLDTITFPSGSAEVPLEQARTLRKVAEAMEQVLDKDPGETFLIEGHTDAVGSDRANLVLSDKRAETVANLLTEVYGIPPENLQVQGYGERFLKIRTEASEQQNRRVAIRRVTSLVRPVAANQ